MSHEALSPKQFGESSAPASSDIRFEKKDHPFDTDHYVEAFFGDEGVGGILWSKKTGEIAQITVAPQHRRKGVATLLLKEARRVSQEDKHVVSPVMSAKRTDDGEQWALSLNESIPERKPV